jgi:hypothetical protein
MLPTLINITKDKPPSNNSTKQKLAGSHRVLATAVDDWSENLLALAPVQAYTYVQ